MTDELMDGIVFLAFTVAAFLYVCLAIVRDGPWFLLVLGSAIAGVCASVSGMMFRKHFNRERHDQD